MSTEKKIKYLTDEDGNRHSVVIPFDEYEEMLEDIQDLVTIAERKNEESISIEDLKKSLKSDGLL
jgi:hypothetical protein